MYLKNPAIYGIYGPPAWHRAAWPAVKARETTKYNIYVKSLSKGAPDVCFFAPAVHSHLRCTVRFWFEAKLSKTEAKFFSLRSETEGLFCLIRYEAK
jgi:hypothetical protein